MIGDVTFERYIQQTTEQIMHVWAFERQRKQTAMLERKLVVFAMSGAFVNELSLTYTSNGLAYDVRIT